MQNSTTILGIIEMRLKGISYDDCRNRYGVGNSTVNLIMTRYLEKCVPLEVLKQMPAEEVEASFYPPSNVRRKSEDIMPDYYITGPRTKNFQFLGSSMKIWRNIGCMVKSEPMFFA